MSAELTPDGLLGCHSCPDKYRMPARYIAHAKRTDGTSAEWPVCNEHAQWAMVAGWFPLDALTHQTAEERDNG